MPDAVVASQQQAGPENGGPKPRSKRKSVKFSDVVTEWDDNSGPNPSPTQYSPATATQQVSLDSNNIHKGDALIVPEDIMVRPAFATTTTTTEDMISDSDYPANPEPPSQDNNAEWPLWLSRAAEAHPWLVGGTAVGAGVVTWYVTASLSCHGSAANLVALLGLMSLLICTVLLLVRTGQLNRLRRRGRRLPSNGTTDI